MRFSCLVLHVRIGKMVVKSDDDKCISRLNIAQGHSFYFC
jgi:hypothetical protein